MLDKKEFDLKPVKKRRAYEVIVTQIRKLIEEGKLKKNDQLPNERELAEVFGVSRSTIREAIKTLESLKIVESRQGDGTYIIVSSEESLVMPLANLLFKETDNIIDIFHIRKILEPYAVQLATLNATQNDILSLEGILKKQKECLEKKTDINETDIAFHSLIARMSRNKVLERLMNALIELLKEIRETYNAEQAKESYKGHLDIYAALIAGDCIGAKKAMLKHLTNIEKSILVKHKEGEVIKCE